MRIGVVRSSIAVAVNPSGPARWPSWKIHTMAPNVAVRLSVLRARALRGTSRLPNDRNSSTNVAPATHARAHGSRAVTMAVLSSIWAPGPATSAVGAGAHRAGG